MDARWTLEFEQMWRCRLQEARNEQQPFRRFIRELAELEITDAFTLAINQIDDMRHEADRLHQVCLRLARYKQGFKVSMNPHGVRVQMMDAPWCESVAPTFEDAIMALARTVMQEAERSHWLRSELRGIDLDPPRK